MKQYVQTNEDGVITAVLEVGDVLEPEIVEVDGQQVEVMTQVSPAAPDHARQSVFDPPLGDMDDLIGRTFDHETLELGPKPEAPASPEQQPQPL